MPNDVLTSLETKYQLPNGLLNAVMKQESGGNINAVSPKGAKGAFQFMPTTAKQYGVDTSDFNSSADGAARMYSDLLKAHNGDLDKALASYNYGQGNVAKHGMDNLPAETKNYIVKVKAKMPQDTIDASKVVWDKPNDSIDASQVVWDSAPSVTAPLSVTRNGKTLTASTNTLQDDLKAELAANPMSAKLAAAGTALIDMYEGGKQLIGMGDKQAIANNKTIAQANPGSAIAGNLALMLGTGVAAPVLNGIKGATAAGAVMGGLTPTEGNSTVKNHLVNAAIGGATGAIGTKVLQGLGNVLTNKAAKAAATPNAQNINLLSKEGISLTPGQYAGGALKDFEDKATSWPIVGNIINNARTRGLEDFNKVAINKATLPNMQVNGVGHGAVQDLRQGLGNAYDTVLAKSSANVNDPQYVSNMANLKSLVSTLPKKEQSAFSNILDREINGRLAPNGNINAENLQAAKSGLGNQIGNFSNSTDAYQRQVGQALKQADAEFRGLIQRANPQNAQKLQAIDTAYANFKRIQKAAASVGSNEGVFTPSQLLSAVKALDKTKDKRAFSEGDALLQGLASAGKDVLPSKVPDSGTAGRLLNNLFSLSGLTSTAGGLAAALPTAAIYSKTGTKAINAVASSNLLKALTTSRYAPMALAGATVPAFTKQLVFNPSIFHVPNNK